MAFTLKERQIMGIHGLLPPTVFNQDQQEERIVDNFHRWDDDLDKFIYLTALQDRNEKLFYKVPFIVLLIVAIDKKHVIQEIHKEIILECPCKCRHVKETLLFKVIC